MIAALPSAAKDQSKDYSYSSNEKILIIDNHFHPRVVYYCTFTSDGKGQRGNTALDTTKKDLCTQAAANKCNITFII